jgi:hypothetical protein
MKLIADWRTAIVNSASAANNHASSRRTCSLFLPNYNSIRSVEMSAAAQAQHEIRAAKHVRSSVEMFASNANGIWNSTGDQAMLQMPVIH